MCAFYVSFLDNLNVVYFFSYFNHNSISEILWQSCEINFNGDKIKKRKQWEEKKPVKRVNSDFADKVYQWWILNFKTVFRSF